MLINICFLNTKLNIHITRATWGCESNAGLASPLLPGASAGNFRFAVTAVFQSQLKPRLNKEVNSEREGLPQWNSWRGFHTLPALSLLFVSFLIAVLKQPPTDKIRVRFFLVYTRSQLIPSTESIDCCLHGVTPGAAAQRCKRQIKSLLTVASTNTKRAFPLSARLCERLLDWMEKQYAVVWPLGKRRAKDSFILCVLRPEEVQDGTEGPSHFHSMEKRDKLRFWALTELTSAASPELYTQGHHTH